MTNYILYDDTGDNDDDDDDDDDEADDDDEEYDDDDVSQSWLTCVENRSHKMELRI